MTEHAIDMNSKGATFTQVRTYMIRLEDGREMSFDTFEKAKETWRFYEEAYGWQGFLENVFVEDGN